MKGNSMMVVLCIGIPTLCYAIASALHIGDKHYPMALVYGAYALANCGMIWYELEKYWGK